MERRHDATAESAHSAGSPSTNPAAEALSGSPLNGERFAFPFRRSAFEVSWCPRSDYRGLLNLKSCEFQHPDADRLLNEVLAELGASDVRSYPFHLGLMRTLAASSALETENVLLTAGSAPAIALIVDALAQHAGALLAQEPVFESWSYHAALRGVPMTRCTGLVGSPPTITTRELRERMVSAPPHSVVAITNPGNPSGLVLSFEEMRELAALAARCGHLLVVDECYGAFADTDQAPLVRLFSNVVVLRSLSKAWGLAGARIAAVFGSPPVVDYLRRFQTDSTVSAPTVALAGALAERGDQLRRIQRDVVGIKKEFVLRVLRDHPRWTPLRPGANFITFDTGTAGEGHRIQRALADRRIRIRGLDDVPGMSGCLRFSIAHREDMRLVADVLNSLTSDEDE